MDSWLLCVFLALCRFSLAVASRDDSSLWRVGFCWQWLLLLQSMGFRHAGLSSCGLDSVVAAHELSCSEVRGIFSDQGSNPCPLHWQVDSYPLHHQGSPCGGFNLYFPSGQCSCTCCHNSFAH